MDGFKAGPAELGWIEGSDVRFEWRAAEGQLGRLPEFASQIVALDVDLIAVIGAVTVRAVRRFVSHSDRLCGRRRAARRRIDEESRPSWRERNRGDYIRPRPGQDSAGPPPDGQSRPYRVAILSDAGVSDCMSNSNIAAARDLRMRPQAHRVEAPSPQYEEAFAVMEREDTQALIVLEEPVNQAFRREIAAMAAARRLPSVFPISMLDAGGLIAFGTNLREAARRMASYADQIFGGTAPGDLPIKAALSHELAINLETARRLGVAVPPDLQAKARIVSSAEPAHGSARLKDANPLV